MERAENKPVHRRSETGHSFRIARCGTFRLNPPHAPEDFQSSTTREPAVNSEPAIVRDVDAGIQAWQARVLQILLVFSSAAMLPVLGAILCGYTLQLPGCLRAICTVLYLVVLLATLRPRWSLRVRAGMLLGPIAVMGAIQLMVGQLAGSGRISLLLVPLLALLLVGPRAGWVAVALTAGLFGLVPPLLQSGGWTGGWATIAGAGASAAYWGLQWSLWLISLLTLMILFTRFQSLQRRSMIAERLARRQLETETAARQRLEEAIGRIGEEERRRLGAELHDGLCQHLTAARLNCSVMEQQRRKEGAPEAESLTQLRTTLEEAIGMAYEVAKGLSPMDIAPDALIPALERLCQEVRESHGIQCRLQAERSLAIRNPEHALHLYRIACEAVANAVKHARCGQVSITLEHAAGELMLQVTDDGPSAIPGVAPPAGLGLGIMAYRAKLIGGDLRVAGGAHGGMQVTCRVPGLEAPP